MIRVLEKDIKQAILAWLSYQKDCMAWPNDTVGIYDATKGVYRKNKSRYHLTGVADILGIWRGKPLAIEVKTQRGVVSDKQALFLERFEKEGGIVIVARSVQDVVDVLGKKPEEANG